MTPAEAAEQHPEIFDIARRLRDQAVAAARAQGLDPEKAAQSVRLRCIHDQDGELILGKRPADMDPPGPVPECTAEPEPEAPYRGRRK